MLDYGEPIKRDITDILISVKGVYTDGEPIKVNENQLYELIDSAKIGSELYHSI